MAKLGARLFVVCIAILLPGILLADDLNIYKWVDRQGVLHYSDKAPTNPGQQVALLTLPALPTPNPQAQAEAQARITAINQWYQLTLKQEAEQRYEQEVAWEKARATATAPEYIQEVSYVMPYWGYYPFVFEHHHHEPRQSHQPAFQTSIWSTQPNSFTQSLYKP